MRGYTAGPGRYTNTGLHTLCSSPSAEWGSRRLLWSLRSCSSSTGDVALVLLAGFLDIFLEPLSDSPSAEVTRRSWRLLNEFHIIFYAKWTRMQLLDMVLACPSCATTELLAVLVSWTFPRAVRTWKYGTFSFTILYLAVTFSVFGCCFRYAEH